MTATGERPVLELVSAELRRAPDGSLFLPDLAERKVEGLVILATAHPDEAHGAFALEELVRLAATLRERKSPRAAKQILDALQRYPEALVRLERRRTGALTREKFQATFQSESLAKTAPKQDAAAPKAGQLLRDLPQARRLGDPSEARARRNRGR